MTCYIGLKSQLLTAIYSSSVCNAQLTSAVFSADTLFRGFDSITVRKNARIIRHESVQHVSCVYIHVIVALYKFNVICAIQRGLIWFVLIKLRN